MRSDTTARSQELAADPSRSPQKAASASGVLSRGSDSRWPEWCALSVYAALVAFAIPFHEPWADEAQAWQLARSLSLPDLFKTFIRYEASPGLWHFLLWILIRAHLSYTGLHWICGGIAVASTALLTFRSPFPRYLKLTLPFTYFLIFQYAVVARNYVLVPPILFTIALWWKKRPFAVAVLLGLLANASLHAAVMSGALAIVYAAEQIGNGGLKARDSRRSFLLCVAIVIGFYAFAIWTAFPPHDLSLSRPPGAHHPFFSWAIASLLWGMCEPWILSLPFWIAIAVWLGARHRFFYLLPVLFFVIFSGAVYANWWHVGLLVPLLISLLWMNWPAAARVPRRYEIICGAAMAVMIVTQVAWSAYAIGFDHYHAYSPDRAAAEFLRPYVEQGTRVAVTDLDDPIVHSFNSIGILPYFDRNIFINLPYAFWYWSDQNPSEERFQAALPSHPRIVVVELMYNGSEKPIQLDHPKYKALLQAGYRFTNLFCGTIPERTDAAFTLCHVIFQYPDAAIVPADAHATAVVAR